MEHGFRTFGKKFSEKEDWGITFLLTEERCKEIGI